MRRKRNCEQQQPVQVLSCSRTGLVVCVSLGLVWIGCLLLLVRGGSRLCELLTRIVLLVLGLGG